MNATSGTGTLYMYSDSGCSTLLPQVATGNEGYILPSTGTTVYVQVKGITESGITVIDLQYGGYTEQLSTTVTSGSTGCEPWVVGTFGISTSVQIACGQTGIVFYGNSTRSNLYQTNSNGGVDGGHFYGPGTNSDGTCPTGVPQFPLAGALGFAMVFAIAVPVLIAMRHWRTPIQAARKY